MAVGPDRVGEDGPVAEVFFEFTQIGRQMRVAAIDVATALEVVIIAPVTASRAQMQANALAKLRLRVGALAAERARTSS